MVVSLLITVLVLIVAIVIDLSTTRVDRRAGQSAVDSAVASAGKTMAESSAIDGCQTGLDYIAAILDAAPLSITSGACSDFAPSTCDDDVTRTVRAERGAYEIIVSNPVVDTSPLIARASVIGDGSIPLTAADASPCDRIGIELTTTGSSFFGGIAGITRRQSTVHAVAAINGDPTELRPVNLLILNRTKCDALLVSGSNTRLIVARPTDDPTAPGIIGVDSNGTGSPTCNGSGATAASINGNGARILAEGLCDDGVTLTCGRIDLFALPASGDGNCLAPNVDNDDVPGCNEGNGFITPDAEPLNAPYTRALIDYQYNCKASYASESWSSVQPIPGCEDWNSTQPHVDQLFTFAGGAVSTAPPGWTVLPGPAVPGFDCNMSGDLDIPQGNHVINCTGGNGFRVTSGDVRFMGGNVVFKGSVAVNGGTLAFNECSKTSSCAPGGNALAWSPGQILNKNQWSATASWVYLNHEFTVSQKVEFNRTSLFVGAGGSFKQASTGAEVKWEAPDEGAVDHSAGPFDDLGLWSRSTAAHTFSGGGSSDFAGLFFGGVAPFSFSGGANLTLDDAQFVADTIEFTGGAVFTMSPTKARTISFPVDPSYSLIR